MTRKEALEVVDELERYCLAARYPGASPESIAFFRTRVFRLRHTVRFSLGLTDVANWAEIFYSDRKWRKHGDTKVRTNLLQSIERVKMRVQNAPDSSFS